MAGTLFDDLSPEMRVVIAATPFFASMVLRLILGRTRMTQWAITLTTMWFTFNVLLEPYSAALREDIFGLGSFFR